MGGLAVKFSGFVVFIIFVCGFCFVGSQENNVCPTFEDYNTVKTNKNCWYNFAADSKVPDIIKKSGYGLEEYKVQTPDGYILTIFRIPQNPNDSRRKSSPVFLQHGISSTSANWLALGNNSLPFVLAREGYDVWLGNYRGTEYSEEHINMTVFDQQYWEHTLDEVSLLDMPTMLEFVARRTGQAGNIIYVGHSLGCTLALMYESEYPGRAKELLKMNLLLAPAHILANMISPYRAFAPYANLILDILRSYKALRIVSQAEPSRKVVAQTCLESPEMMRLCMQVYNLFYGINTNIAVESIPVYFNQIPGGTSIRVLRHAADLLTGFRRYDHGFERNKQIYGSILPPLYDVSKIKTPTVVMVAMDDWATTSQDGRNLFNTLQPAAKHGFIQIRVPNFNHEDFLFGRDAKVIVYDRILRLFEKITRS